jgi:hypothetical protein
MNRANNKPHQFLPFDVTIPQQISGNPPLKCGNGQRVCPDVSSETNGQPKLCCESHDAANQKSAALPAT